MACLNGILCIDKPSGFTSFDVIAKMRGILKMKRLGHAGTLDPMATGVLPVFTGQATKACDIIPDRDKVYEAEFRLGITTDTQDITGKILLGKNTDGITAAHIEDVIKKFRGKIKQIPPMYSAVKVNGRRLYDLARTGVEIERTPREVEIYSLELLDFKDNCGRLQISCSKGTYIRTIINDIGENLNCGGIMTSLIRTKACGFTLNDCVDLKDLPEIVSADRLNEIIYPIENIFIFLPAVYLNDIQERMYRNGVKLDINRITGIDRSKTKTRIYGADKKFIGTGFIDTETEELRVDKNFGV